MPCTYGHKSAIALQLLVYAGPTYIHQAEAWCRVLPILIIPTIHKGSSRTSWVDEELVHVLKRIEAVCATPAEDIDV
jgi:hypothetical protein